MSALQLNSAGTALNIKGGKLVLAEPGQPCCCEGQPPFTCNLIVCGGPTTYHASFDFYVYSDSGCSSLVGSAHYSGILTRSFADNCLWNDGNGWFAIIDGYTYSSGVFLDVHQNFFGVTGAGANCAGNAWVYYPCFLHHSSPTNAYTRMDNVVVS